MIMQMRLFFQTIPLVFLVNCCYCASIEEAGAITNDDSNDHRDLLDLWKLLKDDATRSIPKSISGTKIERLYQQGVSWQPTPLDQCIQESNDSDIQRLNATVLINFSGSPDDLDGTDFDQLADEFYSAYQELGEDVCFELLNITVDTNQEEEEEDGIDGRSVATVNNDPSNRMLSYRRNLDEEENGNTLSNAPSTSPTVLFTFNFSLFFYIIFQCFYCEGNSELLKNDGFRRRRRLILSEQLQTVFQEQQAQRHGLRRSMQQLQGQNPDGSSYSINGDQVQYQDGNGNSFSSNGNNGQYQEQQGDCSISIDGDGRQQCSANCPEFCQAPSRQLFTERYNDIVTPVVPAINEVVESLVVEKYPCNPVESILNTFVVIKLEGDYNYLLEGGVNRDEIVVLTNAVERTFNTMNAPNPETCDILFRRVTRVDYVEAEQLSPDVFSISFDIQYRCRNCAEDTTQLFDSLSAEDDNASERETFNVDYREKGPVELPCYCASSGATLQRRSPTLREFTQVFREMIRVRKGQEKLTFVVAVATPLNGNDDGIPIISEVPSLQRPQTTATPLPPRTEAPTTQEPTTVSPTTSAPTTSAPTTSAPTTSVPTTSAPTTSAPTTSAPTTSAPTTSAPTTSAPTTSAPTTSEPTTSAPTTANPTTANPTTSAPTRAQPTPAVVVPDPDIFNDIVLYPYFISLLAFVANLPGGIFPPVSPEERFPVYRVTNGYETGQVGEIIIGSMDVDMKVTGRVKEVILSWEMLQSGYNGGYNTDELQKVIGESNFEAALVFGALDIILGEIDFVGITVSVDRPNGPNGPRESFVIPFIGYGVPDGDDDQQGGGGGGGIPNNDCASGQFCCSQNLKECITYCGNSPEECFKCETDAYWICTNEKRDCLARWDDCTKNPNGCCDGLICDYDNPFYSQCRVPDGGSGGGGLPQPVYPSSPLLVYSACVESFVYDNFDVISKECGDSTKENSERRQCVRRVEPIFDSNTNLFDSNLWILEGSVRHAQDLAYGFADCLLVIDGREFNGDEVTTCMRKRHIDSATTHASTLTALAVDSENNECRCEESLEKIKLNCFQC